MSIISSKAAKSHEQLFWGREPEWDPTQTTQEVNSLISNAATWYSAMTDLSQQKTFLLEYCQKKFPDKEKVIAKYLPENAPCSIGVFARMFLRGANLPANVVQKIDDIIANFYREYSVKKKADDAKSIKDDARAQITYEDPIVASSIAIADENIDLYGLFQKTKVFEERSMSDLVLSLGCTNSQCAKIVSHYKPLVTELTSILAAAQTQKDDRSEDQKYILESYRKATKGTIDKTLKWLTNEPNAALVAKSNTRKPRKIKPKTTAQILKHFTCQEKDESLKVTSIDADKILGAQSLWVFNTKTRKLSVYNATTEKGLSVERKSITDFDTETSIMKKVRKPEVILPELMMATKPQSRKFMDKINAVESYVSGRINTDMVLLKVYR